MKWVIVFYFIGTHQIADVGSRLYDTQLACWLVARDNPKPAHTAAVCAPAGP